MITAMITITISSTQWKLVQALNRKFPGVDVKEQTPGAHLTSPLIETQPYIQVQAPHII